MTPAKTLKGLGFKRTMAQDGFRDVFDELSYAPHDRSVWSMSLNRWYWETLGTTRSECIIYNPKGTKQWYVAELNDHHTMVSEEKYLASGPYTFDALLPRLIAVHLTGKDTWHEETNSTAPETA